MTIDEAIQELKDASDSEVRYGDTDHHYDEVMKRIEAFDMAIKALEQQPCDDCISRKAVINTIFYNSDNNCDVVLCTDLMDRIKRLPSIQPTRPEGKIIHKAPYGWGYCSECNGVVEPQDRFCSFCGAKMEVEE